MRDAWTLALLLSVAGCGSGNPLAPADGGSDDLAVASSDLAGGARDLAQPASVDAGPFVCGTMTCGGGTICCVSAGAGGQLSGTCLASCGDMGVPVDCRGPENCGGNPCCLSLTANVPTSVLCETTANGCPPMLTFGTASISGKTRLCHSSSDCMFSGSQDPDCCQTTQNGVTQQFCFNKAIAGLTMGQITCP